MTHRFLMATAFIMTGASVLVSGCKFDLESGTYSAEATGTAHYVDGGTAVINKQFIIDVQVAQDGPGLLPDLMIITICQDAISSLAYESCFEPIEVQRRDNHFGGEEIFYSDYYLTAGGTDYGCDQREDVIITGDITSSTSFEFQITYVATIEDWGTLGCSSLYPYPTSVMMSGEAVLP